MGWQERPDLSGEWMRWLLYDSAYRLPDGSRVIDPAQFIKRVKEAKVSPGQAPPAMPARQAMNGGGKVPTRPPVREAGVGRPE